MDSEESHQKFSQKYSIPFRLLSDFSGRVTKLYGVYEKKLIGGRLFWRVRRATFLIDRKGIIRKIWNEVNIESHHRDVLKDLESLLD